ncbi:MAG: shikimate dehydrogenase, partial [Actinomycetes bacterium]
MTSRIAAVIGQPVEHSLSPAIHNAAFAASGRVGEYVAIECGEREVSTLMKSIRAEGLVGLSVTMPLKEAVIDTLDSLHVTASLLNAVNCISFTDGRAVGYNTDGDGCCDALTEQGGAVIEGSTAVVLGAGGTARSVALALGRRGARVVVVNRSVERAEHLVNSLGHVLADSSGSLEVGTVESLAKARILVNATSVGMNSKASPIDPSQLHRNLTILDAVYSPMETALLSAGRAAKATVVDGLWMLIQQA